MGTDEGGEDRELEGLSAEDEGGARELEKEDEGAWLSLSIVICKALSMGPSKVYLLCKSFGTRLEIELIFNVILRYAIHDSGYCHYPWDLTL